MGLQGSRPFLIGIVALLFTMPILGIVAAQEEGTVPADQPAEMRINVYLGGGEDDPFDIQPAEINVPANAEVTFHVTNLQATEHDFGFLSDELFEADEEELREGEDGQGQMIKTPLLNQGETYELNVTVPADAEGSVTFICTVPGHADMGMQGELHVGAAAGDDGEEEIVDLGVHYLAYWVGVIGLIVMVLVLVGTFFLFRYGETRQAVDHRTGGPETITVAAGATGEEQEMVEPILPSPRSVTIVLVVLAALGAIFYFLI